MVQKSYIKLLVVFGVCALSLLIAALIGKSEALGLGLAAFVIIVIPVVLGFFYYPIFGLSITLALSFFLLGILRFIDLPLGTVLDGMVAMLFLGFLWTVVTKKFSLDLKNPLSIMVMIWIVYNMLELVNPFAASTEAWIYTIRAIALTMLLYFVTIQIFSDYNRVKIFIAVWLTLAFMLAAYGIYQEFNGLSKVEEAWARATTARFELLYNWGRFRKFSFFPDPTNFGVTCAYTGVFCTILAIGNKVKWFYRIVLFAAGGMMFFAMVFSGTRTAYVMPVAGLIFYVCLNFNWKVVTVFGIVFGMGAGVILSPIKSLGPLDANSLERIRSAFMPGDDPSFQVRLKNQRFIQPYIQTHPLGGGLGSTGEWGKRFSPWSPLSQFPPDSGFVKIGVEQGLLGLIIYCLMLFFVFKIGVDNYFASNSDKVKNILAAIMTTLFSIIVANYAQETIMMYPTSIIFYCCMGVIVASKNIQNVDKLLKK